MCVHVHNLACAGICGGRKSVLGLFLSHSALYLWRQDGPTATTAARISGLQVPRVCFTCMVVIDTLSHAWLYMARKWLRI